MMRSLRHAGMRLIVDASAFAVAGVHAQQSQPSAEKEFRIVRTDTPPVIDGHLGVALSVSVSYNEDHQVSVTDTGLDPSVDLFYKITPSLNASLTANTDFSATEVDDRQVAHTASALVVGRGRASGLLCCRDGDLPGR